MLWRMTSDETAQARARALSSPVRLRILRLCLHQARTNKDIADALGMNPATTLHHVRTLLATGFLEAEAERKGKRGAKEVPYRSTRLSWTTPLPDAAPVLVETFLQEVNGLAPDEIQVMRVGLRLGENDQRELLTRMRELIEEFAGRTAPEDAVATSLFVAHHIDTSAG